MEASVIGKMLGIGITSLIDSSSGTSCIQRAIISSSFSFHGQLLVNRNLYLPNKLNVLEMMVQVHC